MSRLFPAVLVLFCLASPSPRAQTEGPVGMLSAEAATEATVVERPSRSGGVVYSYDDGAANVNIGPPSTFDPDMLWGNYFMVQAGGEVITEVSVAFGSTFPSLATGPVTFWLLSDPDADGDPRNATALASVNATPTVFGNTFTPIAFPPTLVSGAFFVGASAKLLGGQDRPARVDTGSRSDRSWFFYAPDIAAVINNLATAPFGTRMDDPTNVPFPGAFMVRAAGQDASTSGEHEASSPGAPLLFGASPNPVRGSTTVRFHLSHPAAVTIDVLDVLGRQVAVLSEGEHVAGEHTARWEVLGLPPGVYVCRLSVGQHVETIRLVVVE